MTNLVQPLYQDLIQLIEDAGPFNKGDRFYVSYYTSHLGYAVCNIEENLHLHPNLANTFGKNNFSLRPTCYDILNKALNKAKFEEISYKDLIEKEKLVVSEDYYNKKRIYWLLQTEENNIFLNRIYVAWKNEEVLELFNSDINKLRDLIEYNEKTMKILKQI